MSPSISLADLALKSGGTSAGPQPEPAAAPAAERPAFTHNPMLSLRAELDELEFKVTTAKYTLQQNELSLEFLQKRRRAAEDLLAATEGDDSRAGLEDRSRAEKALAGLVPGIKKAEEAVAVHRRRLAHAEAQLACFNQNYRAEMQAQEKRQELRRQVPR